MSKMADDMQSNGLALAGVQFFFTLGWTVYALMLPGLLATAGIAASWLPMLLMVDQLIFAVMDIGFGVAADRIGEGYRRLAKLLLILSTLSAVAFMLLPMAAGLSSGILLSVLAVWVISTSVVRAPTLVLLAKQAKATQQRSLVIWYIAGMGLALALSPFLGLWLKGADPRLPFTVSAVTLLLAVVVLLRVSGKGVAIAKSEENPSQPASFSAYAPLLVVLGLAAFGFQIHAFVNAAPLYMAQAAKENLPWLMPLLWVGFFVTLIGVEPLVKRLGAMPMATLGILLTALSSYASAAVNGQNVLILLQLLAGAGWALAFAGLMEQAAVAGSRGAEGRFMGSFFAVTAICALARIAFATQWLPNLKDIQFVLPAALLLAAGLIAATMEATAGPRVDAVRGAETGAAVAVAPASTLISTKPSLTLLPNWTKTSFTTPSTVQGTSIVALSDSSVAIASSTLMLSPTLTNRSMTGTSAKSPISGTLTSIS